MAGRLRGNPRPAWAIGLDRALPRLEDQRAVVLVSVLVCDTCLGVTVKRKINEVLHSQIQDIFIDVTVLMEKALVI